MRFTISIGNVSQDPKNTFYPTSVTIKTPEDLTNAAHFDHVAGIFKNANRNVDNFLSSDCIIMDCDNDMENEDFILTPEKLAECFPDCAFCVVSSRSHLKEKNGMIRPRFHVYFPIPECKDAKKYAMYKGGIAQLVPTFDKNAIDAARLIFGHKNAEVLLWQEGNGTILDCLEPSFFTDKEKPIYLKDYSSGGAEAGEPIPQGCRHMTLVRYAAKTLLRFGNNVTSYEAYMNRAKDCRPPLPEKEVFSIWDSSLKWYEKKRQEPGYIPPEEYARRIKNSVFTLPNYEGTLQPTEYTDVGEAKAFCLRWKKFIVWTESGGFWRWNGLVWWNSPQAAIGAIMNFTFEQRKEALDRITKSKKAVEEKNPAGEKQLAADEAYFDFVQKRRMYKAIIATEKLIAPIIEKDESIFDADANLLNTPEGVFALDADCIFPNNEKFFMTKITRAKADGEGMEDWQNFLKEVFINDASLIDYVQKIVGLCLFGAVKLEALIIAYGSGANGKSTFWNTIASVLGSYAGNISAEVLTTSKQRNVLPEIAELKGKRLVIAAELEEGQRLSTSMLKKLCSSDSIIAERKYHAPFSFKPSHTVVLYTNFLPKIGSMDKGTWRRIILLPFLASFTEENDIKDYSSHLIKKAKGGILSWCIEGARRIAEDNFSLPMPDIVLKAVQSYKDENDWLKKYLAACCNIGEEYAENRVRLYRAYASYSEKMHDYIRRASDFYSALENYGFRAVKTNGERKFKGLLLKEGLDELIAGLELKIRHGR